VRTPTSSPSPTLSDLDATSGNAIPEGASVRLVRAEDGVMLRVARFPARRGAFRGTVCLFQGRAEFIEKYFETISDLQMRGYAVAALDWRGQGGSQRHRLGTRRGHIRHFDDFQRDVDAFVLDFLFTECRPPFFALAHSMGGAILLESVRRRPTWFDRLVLTAPMIALHGFPGSVLSRRLSVVLAGSGLSRLFVPGGSATMLGYDRFEDNPLTSDKARFERVANIVHEAPQLCIGSPTVGWMRSAYRAMELFENPDRVADIRTPTLFFAAGEDRVVSNRAIDYLAQRMRTARVITLPAARHEILMERNAIRDSFLAAFTAFVPGSATFAETPDTSDAA
jgi:lysophospholipase